MSVAREINEAIYDALSIVGGEISEIINQEVPIDEPELTDTDIVGQIITLLQQYGIYKVRI